MHALSMGDYFETPNLGNRTNTSTEVSGATAGSTGQLSGRSDNICSDVIIPFFQSLNPFYEGPDSYNDKSKTFDSVSHASRPVELTNQSTFENVCLSAGLVAKLAGVCIPQAKAMADMTSVLCLTSGSFAGKFMQYVRGTLLKSQPTQVAYQPGHWRLLPLSL